MALQHIAQDVPPLAVEPPPAPRARSQQTEFLHLRRGRKCSRDCRLPYLDTSGFLLSGGRGSAGRHAEHPYRVAACLRCLDRFHCRKRVGQDPSQMGSPASIALRRGCSHGRIHGSDVHTALRPLHSGPDRMVHGDATAFADPSTSLFYVPHLALGAELERDFDRRTTVSSIRAFFFFAGTVVVFLVGRLIFAQHTKFQNGQLDPHNYVLLGLFAGALCTISILITAIGTHPLIPRLPKAKDGRSRRGIRSGACRRHSGCHLSRR